MASGLLILMQRSCDLSWKEMRKWGLPEKLPEMWDLA